MPSKAALTLDQLVDDVIPRLKLAETLVLNTLDSLIEAASDPLEVLRRKDQRQRFTLEIYRLRLGLEGLLERHRRQVDTMLQEPAANDEAPLALSEGEARIIDEAVAVYQHVRAFQRGERVSPAPDFAGR